MRWIDVCGPPGVGKSTLCDHLWPPKLYQGTAGRFPAEWDAFLGCVDGLLARVKDHPSFMACTSMTWRSLNKMANVARASGEEVYIQTGFAQRGLGFAWRLRNVEDVRPYFRTMPVSLGVALLSADVATVEQRNRDRGKDRAFMVELMVRPVQIAREELTKRGVPVLELDTRNPVADNVATLHAFARSPGLAVCAGAA